MRVAMSDGLMTAALTVAALAAPWCRCADDITGAGVDLPVSDPVAKWAEAYKRRPACG